MNISKNIHQEITLWQKSTNRITEQWIRDYFEIEKDEEVEIDWVVNDIGGVFSFVDYYFDFNTVLKCYELDIAKEQLFEWYSYCLENQHINISLAKYILSPEERKEKEEKHLQELKERVIFAEQEFKKALKNYEQSR